jgi:chromosomal replication initiator protein
MRHPPALLEVCMNAERLWQAALGRLEIEMPRATFDTWVRDAELLSFEDGEFIIGVENAYARDWLGERLLNQVKQLLTELAGRTMAVRFVVWQEDIERDAISGPVLTNPNPTTEPRSHCHFNERYTFGNFVVGSSNRMAYAAARAVAESPARAYNPLFLYGGVGLGKTHLLHAVGQACQVAGMNVLYVSSEEFTNDLINAIRNHTTDSFRGRYRRMDVLLVDDIQFIAGKESTQEEFFHTFNTLHGQDKQIVVSSDRPPKALVTLEERLRSRFEWGLTVDVQVPDFETRIAILRSKAERAHRTVEGSILEVIARRVQSNIRELEGALTRVLAFSDLSDLPLTPELVEAALVDVLPQGRDLDADQILAAVADHFNIAPERLTGRERTKEVVLPRQVAMFLMREETSSSLPTIGAAIGGRDHTTIMYGCDKIHDLMETDDGLRRQVLALRERLYNQMGLKA